MESRVIELLENQSGLVTRRQWQRKWSKLAYLTNRALLQFLCCGKLALIFRHSSRHYLPNVFFWVYITLDIRPVQVVHTVCFQPVRNVKGFRRGGIVPSEEYRITYQAFRENEDVILQNAILCSRSLLINSHPQSVPCIVGQSIHTIWDLPPY